MTPPAMLHRPGPDPELAGHWAARTGAPGSNPDPETVTASPSSRSIVGVTVTVGGGGSGTLPSNWMLAEAPSVGSSTPAAITHAPGSAQSVVVSPLRISRR